MAFSSDGIVEHTDRRVVVLTGAENQVVLSRNLSRKACSLHNRSTATLKVSFGKLCSASDFSFEIASQNYFEFPFPIYRGIVSVFGAPLVGDLQISEGY